MKQKATRVGLALLVLLVWGAVIARAFLRPNVELTTIPATSTGKLSTTKIAPPVAGKFALERDPFLGDLPDPIRANRTTHAARTSRSPSSPKTPVVPQSPPASKPLITYMGFLKNSGPTGTVCVILGINGTEQVFAVGKESMGIRVQEATSEAVMILCQGTMETVPIAK